MAKGTHDSAADPRNAEILIMQQRVRHVLRRFGMLLRKQGFRLGVRANRPVNGTVPGTVT
jgi:hypothetical protein